MAKTATHPAPVLSMHLLILRRRKVQSALLKYVGDVIDGDALEQLVHDLSEIVTSKSSSDSALMPFPFDPTPAIRETVRALCAGRVVDRELVKHLVARVAGNYEGLRTGCPVQRFVGQPYTQWALVQVVDAVWHLTKAKRVPGAMLRLSVLSGLASGESFVQFFPEYFLDRLAKEIGAKQKDVFRMIHYREMAGMFFAAYLEAGNELSVGQYKVLDSLVVRNRRLAARRGKDRKCPRKFTWPCIYCPIGSKSCPMGAHLYDYTKRPCAGQPPHDGWFDPHDPMARFCLNCQARRRKRAR
jgi:hypothetical protein